MSIVISVATLALLERSEEGLKNLFGLFVEELLLGKLGWSKLSERLTRERLDIVVFKVRSK